MSTLTVEVTQDDIDNGEPNNAEKCAIARAVKRQTHQRCSVDDAFLQFANGKWYRTPQDAIAFIEKYDDMNEEYPEPATFTFEEVTT